MAIKQISVFIENKKGKLSDVVKVLSEADVDIRALSIADTKDFGILRMIVSDTEKAKSILSESFIVNSTDVIAVKMDDKHGALYDVLTSFEAKEINLDYTYAFTSHDSSAYVVFRVDDVQTAEDAVTERGLKVLTESEVSNL